MNDASLTRRPCLAGVVPVVLLLAILAQLPHLADDAWKDLAILPTNAMVVAVCVTWSLLLGRQVDGTLPREVVGRAALALPAGLLGALVYLPHRTQLLSHMHNGFSRWSSAEVLGHWLLASSAQYWPCCHL